ncbi:MAG: HEAT repeat domain-containing protein [Candidatus Brocadiia bacterium]
MRRTVVIPVALAAFLCVGLAAPSQGGEAPPSLDDVLEQVAAYEYGQSRKPLIALRDLIRASHGQPERRAELVGRLTALLSSQATVDAKRHACRQLSIIGGADVVPALARLLPDPELSHMARMGLERIAAPEAGAALRDALGKLQGKLLIGAINSLGERGEGQAAAPLAPFLAHEDQDVARAAAIALGKTGGPKAVDALRATVRSEKTEKPLRIVAANAYLRCADHLVAAGEADQAAAIYKELYAPDEPKSIRVAALRGLVVAQAEKAVPLVVEVLTGEDLRMQAIATTFVREMPGTAATRAFAQVLPRLSPEGQCVLLDALADRGDPAARPAAVQATRSGQEPVRVAAYQALGTLGDASTVPLLAKAAAAGGAEGKAAGQSLDRLRAPDVDQAVLSELKDAEPKVQVALVQSLAARRVEKAIPRLLERARAEAPEVRAEALKALGQVGSEQTLPALVKLLLEPPSDRDRQEAERAIQAVCRDAADRAKCVPPLLEGLSKADVPARCALLGQLGRLGGPKALQAVRDALDDANARVQEAALRSLAQWPDPAPMADLLGLAKTAEKPNHRILALRGYIRLAGLARKSPPQKLAMYRQAMEAATRDDEKKLALGGVGDLGHPAALDVALSCLGDEALRREAAAAVVKIADAIKAKHKQEARAALQKVIAAAKDKRLRQQAQKVLKQVPK